MLPSRDTPRRPRASPSIPTSAPRTASTAVPPPAMPDARIAADSPTSRPAPGDTPPRMLSAHRAARSQLPLSGSRLHFLYQRQALATTTLAFVAPTLAAPLLPRPLQPLRYHFMGLIYADRKLQRETVGFSPVPDAHQRRTGTVLFMTPFIVTAGIRAHLAENHATQPESPGARFGMQLTAIWRDLCAHVPRAMSAHLAGYPLPFVLGHAAAQLTGCAIGAELAAGYYRRQGMQLAPVPDIPCRPSLVARVRSRPDMYLQSLGLFSVPALLPVALRAAGIRLRPALTAMAITSSVALAAGNLPDEATVSGSAV